MLLDQSYEDVLYNIAQLAASFISNVPLFLPLNIPPNSECTAEYLAEGLIIIHIVEKAAIGERMGFPFPPSAYISTLYCPDCHTLQFSALFLTVLSAFKIQKQATSLPFPVQTGYQGHLSISFLLCVSRSTSRSTTYQH